MQFLYIYSSSTAISIVYTYKAKTLTYGATIYRSNLYPKRNVIRRQAMYRYLMSPIVLKLDLLPKNRRRFLRKMIGIHGVCGEVNPVNITIDNMLKSINNDMTTVMHVDNNEDTNMDRLDEYILPLANTIIASTLRENLEEALDKVPGISCALGLNPDIVRQMIFKIASQ